MKDQLIEFSGATIRQEGFATSTEGDFLVGTVTYRLWVDGRITGPVTSAYKLAAGSDHSDPIEAALPAGFDGPIKYADFRTAVQDYVRNLGVVAVGPKAKDVLVEDTEVQKTHTYVSHYHGEDPCTIPRKPSP